VRRQEGRHYLFRYSKADNPEPSCLSELTHFCCGLLQPVRHIHCAVHRHCKCEVLLSLPVIARAVMQFAETEVAVGDKRAHAAWFGER